MVEIQEALKLIDEQPVMRKSVKVATTSALGRVLSVAVYAGLDLPSFDNSAMDGYAVCGSGLAFEVVGEVAAGQISYDRLASGQAMRIFTGAKVPVGTTAVVMQEHVEVSEQTIFLKGPVKAGANIRRQGEEIKSGDLVFNVGHLLNPPSIGVLLSLGVGWVEVHVPPKVSVLVTGNELVDPGNALIKGQVYESNGGALVAALRQYGIEEIVLMRVEDDLESTQKTIERLLNESDVLLISGGISVGKYDVVGEALEKNGVERIFYKVNQKPGKPLFFGNKNGKCVFGLPGNPGSALNCFYIYVLPLLMRFMGKQSLNFSAKWAHDCVVQGVKPTFFRVQEHQGEVSMLSRQSSSMLHSFALGNALVLLQPGEYVAGESVRYWSY